MKTSTEEFGNGRLRPQGRQIITVVDADGNYWVCDHDVDPNGDLRAQGCVRFDDWPLDSEDKP